MRERGGSTIVDLAADYVLKLLVKKMSPKFLYHGIYHTLEVVHNCKVIGFNSQMTPEEYEDVVIAAWFHDTGFIERAEGHEKISAQLANKFLTKHNHPEERIKKITKCIKRTNLAKEPRELMDMVLRDADVAHLGREDFIVKQELLRLEIEACSGTNYSNKQWDEINYSFLSAHQYYTTYARSIFNNEKQMNLDMLKIRLEMEDENINPALQTIEPGIRNKPA